MQLKGYQDETLRTLRRFFDAARMHGAKAAFNDIVNEEEQALRLAAYRRSYRPHNDVADTPYVCLRLPTGGGKTILAAHAVKVAGESWMDREYPLVLWLVPTKTIRSQTVEALKKPGHPYREALDAAFGGAVRVFDIGDFTTILPHDLRSNCCVVVATIQTLRVADTEGRKVYAHHEMLEPHFSGVSATAPGLELIEGKGQIKFSFANLMHLHRPLMIVDEAHNAVTGLSGEMQARVNPGAIIEMTATPDRASNVLHAVSAQEVKDAEMIKLPIVLSEHQTWQQAVTGAIARRAELARITEKDKDYIRPIVLFQAEAKNKLVTVEVLKKHLIEDQGINEKHIAVATGDQRDLDGIDLFKAEPPIEYVITVEALKEGWDCSFAYVFCSMANIKSSTAAEQLLGRVLRMPYAKKRTAPQLNKAYAALVSPTFRQAAMDLRDTLVDKLGYEQGEAEDSIEADDPLLLGDVFDRPMRKPVGEPIRIELEPDKAGEVTAAAGGKIVIDPATRQPMVRNFLTPPEAAAVRGLLAEPAQAAFDAAVDLFAANNRHLMAPAEAGEAFVVPRLVVPVQGELEAADTDVLMENTEWRLLDYPARLTPGEFSIRSDAETWEVDIAGGHVYLQHADTSQANLFGVEVAEWTADGLVHWLDRQVRDPNVAQGDLLAWLRDAVNYLAGPRGISVSGLYQCRHVLMRELRKRLAAAKAKVRENVYQLGLFGPDAKPQLSVDTGFRFEAGMFDGEKLSRSQSSRFTKHFLGWDKVPAFDGKEGGEEEQCAVALDSLPQVKHWVRNVANHRKAFRLPTATNLFYPDFVAELADGRIFVVEYKGKLTAQADRPKKDIGELWGSLDRSKALFLWVEKDVGGRNPHRQMADFLSAQSPAG
jgi:type III restriction enzyme